MFCPPEIHSCSRADLEQGKGNNQAVACAKLSRKRHHVSEAMANVKMIGTVGGLDAFGQQLKDSMVSFGIDDSGVHLAAESTTGMASIYVEKATGQNRIVINAGANALTTSQRILQALRDIAVPIDLIVMQLEVPMLTVVDVLRFSKDKGIATLLNAAPASTLDESIYPCITHLVVNESEAALLTGREAAELDDGEVVVRTASELQGKGVENVIITLGAKGAVLKGRDTPAQHLPAKKVKAIDTTAAGGKLATHGIASTNLPRHIYRSLRTGGCACEANIVRNRANGHERCCDYRAEAWCSR